jgi:hypothetical protein
MNFSVLFNSLTETMHYKKNVTYCKSQPTEKDRRLHIIANSDVDRDGVSHFILVVRKRAQLDDIVRRCLNGMTQRDGLVRTVARLIS